jgi:hypothetical protein
VSETVIKGDLGKINVIYQAIERGYVVSLPMTENARYDIVLDRGKGLERIQIKWTKSKGELIQVRCITKNKWTKHKYTSEDIEAIICYDDYTKKTYYVPASMLGTGRASVFLRLTEPRCTQQCKFNWAKDFENW